MRKRHILPQYRVVENDGRFYPCYCASRDRNFWNAFKKTKEEVYAFPDAMGAYDWLVKNKLNGSYALAITQIIHR